VNPPEPHPAAAPPPAEPREPVSTFTVVKPRRTFAEPQEEQDGFAPAEYAEIDMRTSKRWPHSWQT